MKRLIAKTKEFNSIDEIKQAVDAGKTVCWSSRTYEVIKNSANNEYLIKCTINGHCIGLDYDNGTKKPEETRERRTDRQDSKFISEPS